MRRLITAAAITLLMVTVLPGTVSASGAASLTAHPVSPGGGGRSSGGGGSGGGGGGAIGGPGYVPWGGQCAVAGQVTIGSPGGGWGCGNPGGAPAAPPTPPSFPANFMVNVRAQVADGTVLADPRGAFLVFRDVAADVGAASPCPAGRRSCSRTQSVVVGATTWTYAIVITPSTSFTWYWNYTGDLGLTSTGGPQAHHTYKEVSGMSHFPLAGVELHARQNVGVRCQVFGSGGGAPAGPQTVPCSNNITSITREYKDTTTHLIMQIEAVSQS